MIAYTDTGQHRYYCTMHIIVQECLSNEENPEKSSENLQKSRKHSFQRQLEGFGAQTKNKAKKDMILLFR